MIYATHGVAPDANQHFFVYRNLLDEAQFIEWLRCRPHPFVPLEAALAGAGDALTIDDGTYAAASTAKHAAVLGHNVTVFINPKYSASEQQYFFALLNTALDGCQQPCVQWRNHLYDLRNANDKRELRARVKDEWRNISSDDGRTELMRECLSDLDQMNLETPAHLRTLGIQDLIDLRNAGVAIENHGWTHGEFATFTDEQVTYEIALGHDWIKDNLNVESSYFAVPFGETLPPLSVHQTWKTWFLLSNRRPPGWISAGVYNREEIVVNIL